MNSDKENQILEIAEQAAIEMYGKELIESEKPLQATLDTGVWTVSGTLPENMKGGTVEVKIDDETLEVLNLTHYK